MKDGEDGEDLDVTFEPRQYHGALGHRLWELQQKGILCDVLLEVDGKTLPVHSIVLGASSPFILQLLYKDKHRGNPPDTIRLTGVKFSSCLEMVKYLYLGKLTLCIDNVHQIHKVCTLWEVSSGVEQCTTFLASLKDTHDYMEPRNVAVKTEFVRERSGSQKSQGTIGCDGYPLSCGDNAKSSESGDKSPEYIQPVTQPILENVKNFWASDSKDVVATVIAETKCEAVEQTSRKKRVTGRGRGRRRTAHVDTSTLASIDHSDESNQSLTETERKECSENNEYSSLSERTTTDEHTSKKRKKSFKEKVDSVEETYTGDLVKMPEYLSDLGTGKDNDSSGDSVCDNTICSDKPELQCRRCNKSFPTQKDLGKHNTSHKHKKCRRCHLTFESNEELQEHRKVHQKKRVRKRYECEVCNRDFASLEFLKSHKFTKHWTEDMGQPNYFYCEEDGCDFKALRRCQLYQHKIQHRTDRPFMCDVCGATYKNKYYLKQHVQQCHPDSGPQFTCDQCEQVFKRQRDLRNHIKRVHNKEFPYMCNQCPHRTASKSELNMHMFYKHDVPLPKAKINTCPYCGYKTPCQSVMVTHMQRHNTEKLFQCGVCGKSYNTEKDLKYHFKRHNADRKQHKCNICNFTTAYGQKRLQDHIQNMHKAKEHKPWKCYVCDYKSNLKGNLTQHLRKVHKLTVKTNQHLVKKVTSPPSDGHSDPEAMAEGTTSEPVLTTQHCPPSNNNNITVADDVAGLTQQQQQQQGQTQHIPQQPETQLYRMPSLYYNPHHPATPAHHKQSQSPMNDKLIPLSTTSSAASPMVALQSAAPVLPGHQVAPHGLLLPPPAPPALVPASTATHQDPEPLLMYNAASVSAGLEYVRTALDMNQPFSDTYFPKYPPMQLK